LQVTEPLPLLWAQAIISRDEKYFHGHKRYDFEKRFETASSAVVTKSKLSKAAEMKKRRLPRFPRKMRKLEN
jgi:hypothetical protein